MSIDQTAAVHFVPTPMVEFQINGRTMATRYACTFFAAPWTDVRALKIGLQQVVDTVDQQMSPWIPNSELNTINAAAIGDWIEIPTEIYHVIEKGLEIGRLSDGAFDIGLGELTNFYGFGVGPAATDGTAPAHNQTPAFELIELDASRSAILKKGEITLDLCGIAKGFGVDELARILNESDIQDYMVSIDGELRCSGLKSDGTGWIIAIENPDVGERTAATKLEISDIAIATSGNYRHQRERNGSMISHTMSRKTGCPVAGDTICATVAAKTCMAADAWATALMATDQNRQDLEALHLDALVQLQSDGSKFPISEIKLGAFADV